MLAFFQQDLVPTMPLDDWTSRFVDYITDIEVIDEGFELITDAIKVVVGGFEAGTLLYFRDRTVNLDGKVNHDALEAARAGRSPEYVARRRIDVLVDIESGPPRALRGRFDQWRKVEDMGRYEAWVRRARESTCLKRAS